MGSHGKPTFQPHPSPQTPHLATTLSVPTTTVYAIPTDQPPKQPQAEHAEDVLLKALPINDLAQRLESDIMGRVVGEASLLFRILETGLLSEGFYRSLFRTFRIL